MPTARSRQPRARSGRNRGTDSRDDAGGEPEIAEPTGVLRGDRPGARYRRARHGQCAQARRPAFARATLPLDFAEAECGTNRETDRGVRQTEITRNGIRREVMMTMSSSLQAVPDGQPRDCDPPAVTGAGSAKGGLSRLSPSALGAAAGMATETSVRCLSGTGAGPGFHRGGLLRRLLRRAGWRFVVPRTAASLFLAFVGLVACAVMAPSAYAWKPDVRITGGGEVIEGEAVTVTVTFSAGNGHHRPLAGGGPWRVCGTGLPSPTVYT